MLVRHSMAFSGDRATIAIGRGAGLHLVDTAERRPPTFHALPAPMDDVAAVGDELWIASAARLFQFGPDHTLRRERALWGDHGTLRACAAGERGALWSASPPAVVLADARASAIPLPDESDYTIPVTSRRWLLCRRDRIQLHDPRTERWTRPLGTGGRVVDGAVLFGGRSVALVLAAADALSQLVVLGLRDGVLQHRITLSGVDFVRFAAVRGLALMRSASGLVLLDLRFGQVIAEQAEPRPVLDAALDASGQVFALRVGDGKDDVTIVSIRDMLAAEPPATVPIEALDAIEAPPSSAPAAPAEPPAAATTAEGQPVSPAEPPAPRAADAAAAATPAAGALADTSRLVMWTPRARPSTPPAGSRRIWLEQQLDEMESLIDVDPEAARTRMQRLAIDAIEREVDPPAGRIQEVFAWLAMSLDARPLAEEALVGARDAFEAEGDEVGIARTGAALGYLATPGGFGSDLAALDAELDFVRQLVAARAAGVSGPDPTLVARRTVLDLKSRAYLSPDAPAASALLARGLGLSRAQTALLLAAAAPALDEKLAIELRTAQADHVARVPSAWFLTELLRPCLRTPLSSSELADDRPLVRRALLATESHPDRAKGSWHHMLVDVDPSVLAFLTGERAISRALREHARFVDPPDDPLPWPGGLEPRLARALALAAAPSSTARFAFSGPPGAGKKAAAAALAAACGRSLLVLDLDETGLAPMMIESLVRRAARDAGMLDAFLAIDLKDGSAGPDPREDSRIARALARAAADHREPLLIVARRPEDARRLAGAGAVELHLAPLSIDEQVAHFRRALDRAGARVPDEDDLRRTACHPGLTPGLVEKAAERATADGRVDGASGPPAPPAERLREGVALQVADQMLGIAQRVPLAFRWNDLILPPEVDARLHELLAYVRHFERVFGQWGLRSRVPYGRGANALFAGPPGTGKTMAASVIAAELGIELYRIDLSQVVSKYIGETEKNLARVFDRAAESRAILLFDEADSLFAKRTDVKNSVDRYSNLEVNYLLQRIESFEGVAILTTNFLKNIDEAFRRRLRFIVEFPFPEPIEREALWRSMIPSEMPVRGEIVFERLALLHLAGGSIKNAVLRAAFAAAARDDALISYDLVSAAVFELQANSRLAPDTAGMFDGLEIPPGARLEGLAAVPGAVPTNGRRPSRPRKS